MAVIVRELQGAWNFRDVADSTRRLRSGRLFRSGELSDLGDDGRDELHRLGITDVADLRSRRRSSATAPAGFPPASRSTSCPSPILARRAQLRWPDDEARPTSTRFSGCWKTSPDDEPVSDAPTRYMIDEYRRFPTYNGAQRALQRIVSLLVEGRPVLTHCFAGKDRTGFAVATVLEAAGVRA